jgi:Transport and Golgi organisation 2
MCTVTFIPSGNNYFFTSSRDERANRVIATFPEQHETGGQKLLYPLDPQGGGTWIVVNDQGSMSVLLNGAVEAHRPDPPYRKSRGVVLLEIISNTAPVKSFESSDFDRIEPFTIILFKNKILYSCSWDGKNKWTESLNILKPRIWSSVTLYDPAVILRREKWFADWYAGNPHPSVSDIIRFHKEGGEGDPVNDLLMRRGDGLFTNSISCIRHSKEAAAFRYVDLRRGITSDSFLPFHKMKQAKA